MSDLTFVQRDTAPSIFGALKINDVAVNLAGASVKFQMRPVADLRFTVDASAVVVSAPAGTVRYDWKAGDLSKPGEYVCRWRVTFSDNTVQHSEPENTITIDPM